MGLKRSEQDIKKKAWKPHSGPFKVIHLKRDEGLETPTIQFNKLDLWKDHNA